VRRIGHSGDWGFHRLGAADEGAVRVRRKDQRAGVRILEGIGLLFGYLSARAAHLDHSKRCVTNEWEANVNELSLWLRPDRLERNELPVGQAKAAPLSASVGTMSTRQALVVDDDARTRELVQLHLGLAGYDVTELSDGASAVAFGRAARFDVIVLDVLLPRVDGITVCQALRAQGSNVDTPILMLAARGTESDKVVGLESGADDYMTKPFGMRELMARVNALLRRHNRTAQVSPDGPGVIERRGVLVDVDKRIAIANGQVVDLTKQEFELLHLLLSRPGIVFSREALLSKVWGGDTYVTVRTVDTVISRLRRKLEVEPHDPELILTVWGVGYKCADVGSDAVRSVHVASVP
jgi:DNA-binding response OmpR family regulator